MSITPLHAASIKQIIACHMLLVTAAWKPASVLVPSDPQIRISFYATRIACMNMNMQGGWLGWVS